MLKQKAISPLQELYQMSRNKQKYTLLEWSKALFEFLQFVDASNKRLQMIEQAERNMK